MNGITIENLSKTFVLEGHSVAAVDRLNLHLPMGSITVVIGKSGCGKTTLLRLIAGLEEPSLGRVQCHQAKISVVFQTPRLLPWKNVRENIGYAKPKAAQEEVQNCIDIVKLTGFEQAYPSQLSGGMQSRVAVARALITRPDFLLMDEPFSALDGFTRELLQKELLELNKLTGCGIFFVTHSLDEALVLADRILVMQNGSLVHDISLQDKHLWNEEQRNKVKTQLFSQIQGGKNVQ